MVLAEELVSIVVASAEDNCIDDASKHTPTHLLESLLPLEVDSLLHDGEIFLPESLHPEAVVGEPTEHQIFGQRVKLIMPKYAYGNFYTSSK